MDVYNAGQPPGLAAAIMRDLVAKGYTQGQTGNAAPQPSARVLYGTGTATASNAAKIAACFGVAAQPSAQATLPGNATSVQAASSNDDTNAPLKVSGSARYGIPCVY